MTVFSIGVGSGIKDAELNAMATDPDSTHVFRVSNFASLNNIKGSLSKKTCEGRYSAIYFCFFKVMLATLLVKYPEASPFVLLCNRNSSDSGYWNGIAEAVPTTDQPTTRLHGSSVFMLSYLSRFKSIGYTL